MERLAVFLFVLVTQCQCFLLDEGTQFTHPADSGDRKVFEFYWDLTWETSMLFTDANDGTWAVKLQDNGDLAYTDDTGKNITVNPADVTTLDGALTKYIAVNGQFPGPTIEVPFGAEVYVHVTNKLLTDSATVHWHGLQQRNTVYSDGAPYITQCPIAPGSSFTYKFNADEAGTFWYHSHLGPQRMDGLFGALIVHDPKQASYPEFTVMVNDWLHIDGNAFFSRVGLGPGGSDAAQYTSIPDRYNDLAEEDVGDLPSNSFLVNGRGRFDNNKAPLTVHKVKFGDTYMFRIINVGYDNMFEVSIDGHQMTVVGTDSCEVEPIVVDSVFLAIGERVNVLVKANSTEDNYWVRYRAPHKNQTPLGHSILTYNNSTADPTSTAKTCTEADPCVALNCPFQTAPGFKCIPIDELRSTAYHDKEIAKIRDGSNLSEHFFAYSYMAGDSINGKTLVLPHAPFYQEHYTKSGVSCDPKCLTEGCSCTHVEKIPRDRVVQIVVMHHVLKHFIHTWHMHGYRFAVVRVVYPPKDPQNNLIMTTLNRDITCSNDFCHDARWINSTLGEVTVDRPPLKDTVSVPVGGYVIVRIYTDNPGYWMAHCHQTEHLHEGMAMVLDIDGESMKNSIPAGFPTCGNFIMKP